MTDIIQFPGNHRNQEAQPALNGAQKESVARRWPIRHIAAANVVAGKQRMFPETFRAISQPAVQAEVDTDNVVPTSSRPRYEYHQDTNEAENRFEARAAREAIADAFGLRPEGQTDVEETA